MIFSKHTISTSIFFREDDITKEKKTLNKGWVREITWLTEKHNDNKNSGKHSWKSQFLQIHTNK